VLVWLGHRGYCFDRLPTRLLYEMIEREPPIRGGGTLRDDGTWSLVIPRLVNEFQEVASLEEYVAQLEALGQPPTPPAPAAPSPLGLVAAIDYLDTVWRLVPGHTERLFDLHSAQRAAQLAFPATTADEFASRLSGLAEILRSVQVPQRPRSTRNSRSRDKPFSRLERHLLALLPGSQRRIRRAVEVLHRVIDIRDAGQHSVAGRRGAAALVELGVGYPPTDWASSWSVVAARTIEALDAIREELATITV
jgi:hypothetical protein